MNVQSSVMECPVAALAREAMQLIDAHKRLDKLSIETRGQGQNEVERQFDAVEARIYALGTAASYLRARSGIGVMYQLHQIASLVDVMTNPAGNEEQQEEARAIAEAAITRMLYSVRDEVERITGERAEDASSDYYMNRKYNPFDLVDNALAEPVSIFGSLLAQYQALDTEYRSSPDNIALAEERKIVDAMVSVLNQMKEAPIASKQDVVGALRLINSRLNEDSATSDIDRMVLRNIQSFMEG